MAIESPSISVENLKDRLFFKLENTMKMFMFILLQLIGIKNDKIYYKTIV